MEMLKGQRADLGLQRAWEGNYLASVSTRQQCGTYSRPFYKEREEFFSKNLQKG
jgi:hypothetical protein